jgi:tetratricopeptide (TPR) repeat protein
LSKYIPDEDDTFGAAIRAALASSQAEDGDSALGHLRQAALVDPTSGLPHLLMAGEFAEMQRYEDAEASFARAILLGPQLTIARFQLGLLQFTSGRIPMAFMTWQPLAALGPDDPLVGFVDGFVALASEDLSTARSAFERGLALDGTSEPLRRDIARIVTEIDRLSSASASATVEPRRAVPPQSDRADGQGVVDARTQDEAQGDAMHVLLAGYRHSGRPH